MYKRQSNCTVTHTGVSTIGSMADVLVGAKQQAEKIILERLNGYNFAKQYVAMGNLLANLSKKKEELIVLKRRVMEVCVCVPVHVPVCVHVCVHVCVCVCVYV